MPPYVILCYVCPGPIERWCRRGQVIGFGHNGLLRREIGGHDVVSGIA